MDNKLQEAITAIKAGDKLTGYRLLVEVIKADPQGKNAEDAWLWMSVVVDDPEKRRKSLETVLSLNPNNETARKRLSQLQIPPSQPRKPTPHTLMPRVAPKQTQSTTTDTKQCPFCAETIKMEAKICRFCNRQIAPLSPSENQENNLPAKQGHDSRSKSGTAATLGILAIPILFVFFIIGACCVIPYLLGASVSNTFDSLTDDPTRAIGIPATYTPRAPGSGQARTLNYSGNGYDSKIVQVPSNATTMRIAMDGNGAFTYFEVWGRGDTLIMDGACETNYCSINRQARLRSNETEIEIIFNSVRQFGLGESSRWSAQVTFE
jgi:hypothetical protein